MVRGPSQTFGNGRAQGDGQSAFDGATRAGSPDVADDATVVPDRGRPTWSGTASARGPNRVHGRCKACRQARDTDLAAGFTVGIAAPIAAVFYYGAASLPLRAVVAGIGLRRPGLCRADAFQAGCNRIGCPLRIDAFGPGPGTGKESNLPAQAQRKADATKSEIRSGTQNQGIQILLHQPTPTAP